MDPYRVEAQGFEVVLPCRRCGDEADPTLVIPVRPIPTPLCPPCYIEWAGKSFKFFEWWRMHHTRAEHEAYTGDSAWHLARPERRCPGCQSWLKVKWHRFVRDFIRWWP